MRPVSVPPRPGLFPPPVINHACCDAMQCRNIAHEFITCFIGRADCRPVDYSSGIAVQFFPRSFYNPLTYPTPLSVIPAKAGTQLATSEHAESLGPDFRRDDKLRDYRPRLPNRNRHPNFPAAIASIRLNAVISVSSAPLGASPTTTSPALVPCHCGTSTVILIAA